MRPAFAVGLVFAGCCSNVIFLELLARYYAIMVTMFFTVSVMNNYALNLNIAMPLHMIFRSGSLIANMILGIIILKKRYSMFKYTSIALVSAGIFICTFMSAKQVHALPLPGFIFLASDIYDHVVLFNKSELYQVPVISVAMPIMWFYLLMNVVTQYPFAGPFIHVSVLFLQRNENSLNQSSRYVCIRGVFILTTECTSLTVTLVVTLRKFVSLIFSILYFQNPFTLWHCLGTLFVFIGTLMYTEVWKNLGTTKSQLPKDDKKD
ncbi:UDP-xylose and UDP-N-acetylglucosamine transporter [Microtus ochrogaster]|uniref:Solute carrier family 35 member B4 n=1 Tax=Microtus ochrogaster TaxID=79684 RepID=A0A8J6GFS4_MICOH|nr:UDP-xylose and UDP-N-acetylglucosamine transporter [Microtus ochrogaster]